ncbi:hypothetical protein E2C01_004497 [Portunus trituberculatus]|uniref:Uncharacterized protein n=1 Tax=Portunus trituberculatus TaxID=210409 RepID=A0A5B7CQ55_PORTR|nr:hypothetical protein [Portunus trituberculatus]
MSPQVTSLAPPPPRPLLLGTVQRRPPCRCGGGAAWVVGVTGGGGVALTQPGTPSHHTPSQPPHHLEGLCGVGEGQAHRGARNTHFRTHLQHSEVVEHLPTACLTCATLSTGEHWTRGNTLVKHERRNTPACVLQGIVVLLSRLFSKATHNTTLLTML